MIPSEAIHSGAPTSCPECGVRVELDVYLSAAGFYIGTYCGCGPYSRESGYYPSEQAARSAMVAGGYERPGIFPPSFTSA